MKAPLFVLMASITVSASAAGTGATGKSRPSWMAGEWAWVDLSETLQPGQCPHSEIYEPNGQMTDGELGEVYKWWIEGDQLVRVLIKPMEGEPQSEVGRTHRHRFTKTPAGDLVFRGDDWAQKMVRCGDR